MGEIFFDVFTLVPRDLIDVRLILLSFIELNEMKKNNASVRQLVFIHWIWKITCFTIRNVCFCFILYRAALCFWRVKCY